MSLPDSVTLAGYGGLKSNLAPVEDYTTDEDANDRNECFSDCAGMTHTAFRAWRSFIGDPATPGDPASYIHDANWGNDVSLKAAVATTGTGVYTITWPTTFVNELGETKTINLRRAVPSVEGNVPYFVTATVTSPNVVTVRVFNTSGTANAGTGVTFTVFAT